jgi:MraZ protein
MVFTDAYERTIDGKKRIQIPAEYRGVLARETGDEAFYLCPGERKNTLALYPESTFRQRAEQLRTEEISSDDALAFEQLYYSVASRLELDKQGRVVLSPRLLALVELGERVTLAGANTRIDLWATAEYDAFLRDAFASRWQDLQAFMRQTLARGVRSE